MPKRPFLALALVAAACSPYDPVTFDGYAVDARLKAGADKRDMAITVRREEGISFATLKEAARYEATRHCIDRYGASDTDWEIDVQTGDWAFTEAEGRLTFRGRCTG
jgi:hypothetical protein